MTDVVAKIDVFEVALTQDQPYLGSLREGEQINERGYFVRRGNRTVYPRHPRSIVVRITTRSGLQGWGETYGLVAPRATAEIIHDLLTSFVIGRDPDDVESIHDELSDLMRVRGYIGGYYSDALAAIDIGLWDLMGKQNGTSLCELWGGSVSNAIPAYLSGLPKDTLAQRCDLAQQWQSKGYNRFKFALPVADEGPVAELRALRETLGVEAEIACDLHWAYTSTAAISLARQLQPDRPWFLEAPVSTEDLQGLARVASQAPCPIAVGEEWRTLFDAQLRIDSEGCQIIQPEMGHTGITQFMRIARHAKAHDKTIMPHATLGCGLFLAASLQASASLQPVVAHEFQHSIFEPMKPYTTGEMACEKGFYRLPTGKGIGVEPTEFMKQHMTLYP